MKKIVLMIAPLLIAAPAFAQNVTLETSGERLETLLPKIGAAFGWKITADPAVRNEVLILDVKDIDTRALLEKIASVTGLEWMQSGGGYILTRSTQANATAWQIFSAWTSAGLKEDIAKDESVQSGVDTSISRGPGRNAGPERSAILSMVRDFPVDLIANQDVGSRMVFSSFPTKTQRPLPTLSARWASQASVKVIDGWRVAASRLNPQNEGQRRAAQAFEARIKTGIAKHILIVQRTSIDRYVFTLQFLDSNASVVSQAGHALAARKTAPESAKVQWKTAKKDWDDPTMAALKLLSRKPAQIQIIPDSLILDSLSFASQGQIEQVIGEVVGIAQMGLIEEETIDPTSILKDPANHEPFAVAAGYALRAQKPDGVNLIAYIPDTLMSDLAQGTIDGKVLEVLADSNSRMQSVTADGWVTVSPVVVLEAWNTRVDRQAFSKVLAETISVEGKLSIASKANYAATVPLWESTNSWDVRVTESVVGRDAASDIRSCHTFEREGLAMWRALNGKMGQQSKSTFSVAAAFDRRWIEYAVFNSQVGPVRVQAQPNNGRETVLSVQFRGSGGQTIETSRSNSGERTEMLPNGLAVSGQVTATRRNEQRIVLRSSKTGQRLVTTPQGYAWMLAQARNAVRQDRRFVDPGLFDQFGMTGEDIWTFTTEWPDGVVFSRTARGQSGSPNLGAYTSLPANIRADVDREMARAAESIQRQNQGGRDNGRDNRRVPPPL